MSFHDIRFPIDISRGATGGGSYRTTVVETASGGEQRNVEWDYARYRWTINIESWNPDRLADLLDFFHARQGRAFGFRFQDPIDFYAGMVWDHTGLNYSTPVLISEGTGVQTVFKLVKRYVSGPTTILRRITRPVAATVKVYLDGVLQTTGYTLNASTGTITFSSAPGSGVDVQWAGEFDVPARFDVDEMNFSLAALQNGTWQSVPIISLNEPD
jgi:hypothetical protein